ncbi:hypothetical protein [Streptomyces sp. NPDC048527]|uniref:hypothetical protein n=1 Tax=Streptomyces sp. NPDC048527 TaxID=3365568 RepID=UPI00371E702F
MTLGRRMNSLRFLLRDQDSKYTRTFDAAFEANDVETLLSPPQAPRANAICERVVGTLRREALDQVLIPPPISRRTGSDDDMSWAA